MENNKDILKIKSYVEENYSLNVDNIEKVKNSYKSIIISKLDDKHSEPSTSRHWDSNLIQSCNCAYWSSFQRWNKLWY